MFAKEHNLKLPLGEECGHPGEPANGTLLSSEAMFYPGEQVSYTCNQVGTPTQLSGIENLLHQGFFLSAPEGGGRRACGQDGRWTGDIPVCCQCHQSSNITNNNQIIPSCCQTHQILCIISSHHLQTYPQAFERLFACSGKPGTGQAGDPVGRAVELQAGLGGRWRPEHLQLHLQGGESSLVAGAHQVDGDPRVLLELSEYFIRLGNFAGVYYPQLCVLFNRLIGHRLAVGWCMFPSFTRGDTFYFRNCPIISYFLPQYHILNPTHIVN